jgi:hypothetical protein
MVKLVDTRDLKSLGPNPAVPVRFRLRAPAVKFCPVMNATTNASDMIVFDLICANDHAFEGWFASSDEFVRQLDTGMLSCPVCRDHGISKRPSPVHINRRGGAAAESCEPGKNSLPVVQLPAENLQQVLDYLLKHTEDVGNRFAEEARRIYQGEAPLRGIRGQADIEQIHALQEEGIDVMPLPIPSKEDFH